MPDLALIAQALDFVELNLKEPIAVADMAGAVGYSLYHFCRTFNQATHHTPYDYLMRRRLAESARALFQTDEKIIDVALDYQFNNPETFSRAFKRVFDTQPSQFRKRDSLDSHRLMPRLTLAHLQHIAQGPYLRPVLMETASVRVAGLMTLVGENPTVIEELWRLLDQHLEACSDVAKPPKYYGLITYSEGWLQRGYFYLAAVEVQEQEAVGVDLVEKALPALTCARFIHKGPRHALSLTLDYVFHTWLPKSGCRLAQPWIIEHHACHFRGAGDPASELVLFFPIER